MSRMICWAALSALLALGCGADKPAEDDHGSDVDPNLRIGHVMIEVGHRLEMSGRAAEAENWGLSGYEAEEIVEMFNMDMTRSLLPGVCDDSVSDAMYENLLTQLPELRDAAEQEDAAAYAAQFRTVSSSCNGCHAGCQVSFIRVPSRPGLDIPMVELADDEASPAPPEAPSEASEEAAEEAETDAEPTEEDAEPAPAEAAPEAD